MEISYARAAVKVINALDRPTKQRIKKAVEGLPKGDIVPLSGSTRLYRLRVGDFRVLFDRDGNILLIIRIDNRGQVYKK